MSSIVLDPEIKDMIMEDAKDFMSSESWYADRGIPFRRGYLLYGAPGSGKTSLIHALAGELKLDVYVISLSRRGFDDAKLNEMISDLPPRAIALIEDIDASFTTAVGVRGSGSASNVGSGGEDGGGVTLAGLLGAIDGVAAQEGRLLFATTNHIEVLDPALTRPGRMDVHVEFRLATKWQARELFKSFFPPAPPSEVPSSDDNNIDVDEKDTNSSLGTTPTLIDTPSRSRTSSASSRPMFKASGGPVRTTPKLSAATVDYLAKRFADAIPDNEVSMAALQGHLMCFKRQPREAVDSAPAWIAKERAAREARAREAETASAKAESVVSED
ncbi:AAA family ATPase [Ceratobasidium sp. AG-Ba]|nr:AAA family ATPase [Ceratobasidium sp. AG-Ba]